MFTPLFSNGWYKRDKENIRRLVFNKDYTAAQTAINELITTVQNYLDNLPEGHQTKNDFINAETIPHLQHAKRHIDEMKAALDIGAPYPFDDTTRDYRTQRIFDDNITVI